MDHSAERMKPRTRRTMALGVCLLAAGPALARLDSAKSLVPALGASLVARAGAGQVGTADPAAAFMPDLAEQLESARQRCGAPAMAASVVDATGRRHMAVCGERAKDTGVPVADSDLWHIGSISKSFTALLAGRLVDAGVIRWDTTIIEALPMLEGQTKRLYHRVTLEQLLGSRGGVPGYERQVHSAMAKFAGSMREQRMESTRRILNLRPVGPPGGAHVYSNFGFIVAAAMLEEAAGEPWEALVLRHIAEPLGMASLGFGPPGDPASDAPDQPWGHVVTPSGIHAIKPGPSADNPAAYNSAGRIHANLNDLTNYAQACLGTLVMLRDPGTADDAMTPLGVRAATARRIFDAPKGEPLPYALGWVVRPDHAGRIQSIWHNGSNTMWYAELLVVADEQGGGRAAFVCANGAGQAIEPAVASTAKRLVQPLPPRPAPPATPDQRP